MTKLPKAREQMYYVIVMPLNAEGNGPCSIPEAVELDYQVWDQTCTTFSSNKYLPDAIDDCNMRNAIHNKLLNNEPVEQSWLMDKFTRQQ